MDTHDKSGPLHIAVGFDLNYLKPFYALLSSLQEHHLPGGIYIHAIAKGISMADRQGIETYVRQRNNHIQFYTIDENQISGFVLFQGWTAAAYYRLLLPHLIEDVNRILYLDTDIIVIRDLTDFYYSDLDNHPIAAVYDNYVKTQPLIGITEEGEYFNSGVLLIDVDQWKNQKVTEHTFEYLTRYPEKIQYVDQCALNAVLKGNWKKVDWKYNVIYSRIPETISMKQLQMDFLPDKSIIHFTIHRPWHQLSKNRLGFLYKKYILMSPAKGGVISDWSFAKTIPWLKIKLLHLYFDSPWVVSLWRKLKS